MDKPSSLGEWFKGLPSLVKEGAALLTAIIGCIILFRENFPLGIIIFTALGLLAIFRVCLYVIFTRNKPAPGRFESYRFGSAYRSAAIIVMLLAFFAVLALVLYQPSRSFVVAGIKGVPTPTPLALIPAQSDETLLIIADFDNRSAGQIGVDPAQRIYNLIIAKLPAANVDLRVEQYHHPVKDSDEARRVMTTYGAALLIWGWYDQVGAQPTIELDKSKISIKSPTSAEFSFSTPESFAIRFTEDIPAQAGYVTFFSLGVMQLKLGERDTASSLFSQAIDSANKSSGGAVNPWEALMWRGNIYGWNGERERAVQDYTDALALHPHREGFFNRGVANGGLQKFEQAIADYSAAIEMDPNYKEAYFNRAYTYGNLHNYEMALADYTTVIRLDPNESRAFFNRGYTYHVLKDYEDAIADFSSVIRLDPNDKGAYFARGVVYSDQRKYAGAIADYSTAIRIDPDYKEVYFNRASIYAFQQQYDLAVADYGEIIQLDPDDHQAYADRGNAYRSQEKYDQAIADYTAAIELMPGFAGYYTGRGNVYADWGKYAQAVADYQHSLSLDPAPYTYCVLGITYTKTGEFISAVQALEQGVSLDQGSDYPWCKTALDNALLGTPSP